MLIRLGCLLSLLSILDFVTEAQTDLAPAAADASLAGPPATVAALQCPASSAGKKYTPIQVCSALQSCIGVGSVFLPGRSAMSIVPEDLLTPIGMQARVSMLLRPPRCRPLLSNSRQSAWLSLRSVARQGCCIVHSFDRAGLACPVVQRSSLDHKDGWRE